MSESLKKAWLSLASSYTSQQDLVLRHWEQISHAYASSDRYYHTLSHLEHLFSLWQQYQQQLEDPDAVFFSIFYHDIIYVIGDSNNEERSAELAGACLAELGVPETRISRVMQQIRATRDHLPHDQDTSWLIDFDLSILGEEPSRYSEYAAAIRKEFHMIPEPIYLTGRLAILSRFLTRERLYRIPVMHDRFEKQARENINAEMAMLREKLQHTQEGFGIN